MFRNKLGWLMRASQPGRIDLLKIAFTDKFTGIGQN